MSDEDRLERRRPRGASRPWHDRSDVPEGVDLAELLERLRPAWHQDAACAGTDPRLFVPEDLRGKLPAEALALCEACPVQDPCAEQGAGEQYGIWAGKPASTLRQRRRKIPAAGGGDQRGVRPAPAGAQGHRLTD